MKQIILILLLSFTAYTSTIHKYTVSKGDTTTKVMIVSKEIPKCNNDKSWLVVGGSVNIYNNKKTITTIYVCLQNNNTILQKGVVKTTVTP